MRGARQPRRMRSCLIVDDSEPARRTVEAAVRAAKKGVDQFHDAEDAATALRLFEERAPDLVFLDMMLAGDDVHAPDPARASGLLRAMLDRRPDVAVVVVAGPIGPQPDVVDAISLGAIAALRKPIQPAEVKHVLDALAPDTFGTDFYA